MEGADRCPGGEAGAAEAAIDGGEFCGLGEKGGEVLVSVLALEPGADELVFVKVLKGLADGLIGDLRGDLAAGELGQDAGAAELAGGGAGGGEGLGEAAVIESAVFLEPGDDAVDGGRVGGAGAETLFELGDGEGAGGEQAEGIVEQFGFCERRGFLFHGLIRL